MRRGLPGTAAALLALWAAACSCKSEALRHSDVGPPASFAIPFEGSGQLASIWISGPYSELHFALVVTYHGRIRRLPLDTPQGVRWRSPPELIVAQQWGRRVVRMSREGEVLEVLSDTGEPSPDGRWLAVLRSNPENDLQQVQIRDLEGGFALRAEHRPRESPVEEFLLSYRAWSPDSSQLALTIRGWIFLDKPRQARSIRRTAIVARDRPDYELLPDDPLAQMTRRSLGCSVLFWTERGIFGKSFVWQGPEGGYSNGDSLLRCDPGGSGCRPVYNPGPYRRIAGGRRAGADTALLLVEDDRIELLWAANEIHQVDLATGEGGVLLRLPKGVFIYDIDWSPDPAGE